MDQDDEPSYIDYETFLAPDFDEATFANSLVLATNDPQDAPLDLATPLSRVLFDIQEIDSHIDLLTARAAVPLLTHTGVQTQQSTRAIADLDPQIDALNASYRQLERQVLQKHAEAEQIRQVVLRLWETFRLGRSVGRCLQLGRQLEVQYAELMGSPAAGASGTAGASIGSSGPNGPGRRNGEDHRALVRCAHTILSLREILVPQASGDAGHGLDKVDAIRTLQDGVVATVEKAVRETSERIVREFSLGASAASLTFAQAEDAKARTVSALVALYLVSPTNLASPSTVVLTSPSSAMSATSTRHSSSEPPWTPSAMVQAVEAYIRAALQSSLAGLARSLASLPTLDRTLSEVSARCQNIVALEQVLASTKAPAHPLRSLLTMAPSAAENATLLPPLLVKLETGSLPSYFWRTLASHLSPRVQDIMTRGGVAARTLRSNKTSVGDSISDCVVRGLQLPGTADKNAPAVNSSSDGASSMAATTTAIRKNGSGWEREIAVMVGSVTGQLGR